MPTKQPHIITVYLDTPTQKYTYWAWEEEEEEVVLEEWRRSWTSRWLLSPRPTSRTSVRRRSSSPNDAVSAHWSTATALGFPAAPVSVEILAVMPRELCAKQFLWRRRLRLKDSTSLKMLLRLRRNSLSTWILIRNFDCVFGLIYFVICVWNLWKLFLVEWKSYDLYWMWFKWKPSEIGDWFSKLSFVF